MWEERIVNIIVGHRSFCCCSEVQVYLYYCSSFFTSWHNGFFFFPMSDLVPIVPRTGPAKACLTPAMGRVWSFLQPGPGFIPLLAREKLLLISIWKGHRFQRTFPLSSRRSYTRPEESSSATRAEACFYCSDARLKTQLVGWLSLSVKRRQKAIRESHSTVTFYWAWSSSLCVLIGWK